MNRSMWKPANKLTMTEEQCTTLKAWVRAKTSPQRTVLRARICLLAAEGLPNGVIAKNLKTSRPTVLQWRKRFEQKGPEGLAEDAPPFLVYGMLTDCNRIVSKDSSSRRTNDLLRN